MLNIKTIVSDPEGAKKALLRRGFTLDIESLLALDLKRRELIAKADGLKAEQNAVSKAVPQMKKEGKDTTEVFARMKQLSDEIKLDDEQVREIDEQLSSALLNVPNMPDESTPDGFDESANVEVRKVGEVKAPSFTQKPHWEIGANLGILDPETAAKVTGARFHFYKGAGARLERAVINFYLDSHGKKGYTEILPPFLVNRASMTGTGQLPKFEEDAFHLSNEDYFLIPTAEVPVTNMHRNEILDGKEFPLRYCAYSACFRAEAGSAGRDTRGLIRQHQFNKVELVWIADPEKSFENLEELTRDAGAVLEALELPYRVVALSSGDLGFSSAKTYDLEVWMPSYQRYVEISSCSNFVDYQARRASIRFKRDSKDKAELAHTLNGSGVAIGRTVAAILENFQNEDGSVNIPKALQPYMGTDIIAKHSV